jgi:hypothetical protein
LQARAHDASEALGAASQAQKAWSDNKPAEAHEFLQPMQLMTFCW